MPKTYKFTEEQKEELYAAQKKNKDKNVHKRLTALIKRAEGESRETAALASGLSVNRISALTSKYMNEGIGAIVDNHYTSHNRNMSVEEEAALLAQFKSASESGQIVSIAEIKAAYDKALGRKTNDCQIYKVLDRHDWQKVMPRSRHPKKASEEAIEASKKLKLL